MGKRAVRPSSAQSRPAGKRPAEKRRVRLGERLKASGAWLGRQASDLRPHWNGFPPHFRRSLLISLGIAFAIEGLLHMAHEHPRLTGAQDQAMDWMIGIYRNVQPRRDDPVPFTLLEIDDETFRRWGTPLFVPRDKLARLIETVAAAGPRLIVVDVGLASPSGTPGDERLRTLLARWSTTAESDEAQLAPLILLASFRQASGASHRGRGGGREAAALPERRRSFLDDEVAAAESILWASPLFVRGPDWVVRRWNLWQAACSQGGADVEILPSIQLLTAALLAAPQTPASEVVRNIETTIAEAADYTCGPPTQLAPARAPAGGHGDGRSASALEIGETSISLASSRLNQRIVFRYPYSDELRPGESYPVQPVTGKPLLSIVPAYPITEGKPVDPTMFRDRIVVIGGTFAEGRDIHLTPLGVMPGALVIVNAMDSLLEYGQLEPVAWPARYGITIVLVLIMSVVFTFFKTIKGALVALSVLAISLLPLSVMVFKAGYWVDFAVPMLAVYLHKMSGEVERLLQRGGARTAAGLEK